MVLQITRIENNLMVMMLNLRFTLFVALMRCNNTIDLLPTVRPKSNMSFHYSDFAAYDIFRLVDKILVQSGKF